MSLFATIFNSSYPFSFKWMTEWHSHILPGVDYGVENMEDFLAILNEYENLGIEKVWLTPHIMEDVPNTIPMLQECFSELKESYSGHINLNLSVENMIDKLFIERLESGESLPIGDKKYAPDRDIIFQFACKFSQYT